MALAVVAPTFATQPQVDGTASAPAIQEVGSSGTLASVPVTQGETLCLMGGALAERMQHHGWLETRLQQRFLNQQVRVRNLGFGGDEVNVHQRTMNFGKFSSDGMDMDLANTGFVVWDRFLEHCDAGLIFGFFGYNESYGGLAGVRDFRAELAAFIDNVHAQKYNGVGAPRLVLFSSIPFENFGDSNLPDGREINERIELYNLAMASVAKAKGVRFVDIYRPMAGRYASESSPLTINGIHLNSEGNRHLAEVMDQALWGAAVSTDESAEHSTDLREAILVKNKLWFNRYRATDGYNVYGARSKKVYVGAEDGLPYSNFEVLQRELDHIDDLCEIRDRGIWALAKGDPEVFDDSTAVPLLTVGTNKLGQGRKGEHLYLASLDGGEHLKVAAGLSAEIFADERQFPELVNPVQMAWDTRGRLWVATWQTYPHWQPDRPMNDKLLILEDTDGDGRANTCTVFADDLHNPTGIEFWNGGVLLGAAPDLMFLKDTDGDDRADVREHLLHGLSSADTHHGANSFVLGPDGALYFQEGTFHQSQVESVHGPVRNRNGCVWRFNPRTWEVERYIPYNFANPHGHVFDRWGQDFMTDGTGNVNYYALPFSGHLPEPLKHSSYFPFFPQRSRPSGGTEFLSSGHFPEEFQGNYLIANVIGFRGIFRYKVNDDGSGFSADELEPIVQSDDLNFRPVDIEMGPDGAMYFLDWHNALIGHLQHHLRDPSRDAAHGRVYRVTYPGRELLKPASIAGEPIEALLELLKSPEDRTRYRTRIELSGRDSDEVAKATVAWIAQLDSSDSDFEHHRLEALWTLQQHNRSDRYHLLQALRGSDPRARAAATRIVRYSRHLIPDALDLLRNQVADDDPRVRLEAVVAASFFPETDAVNVALEVLKKPTDKFIDYALKETMRGLESTWQAALQAQAPLATDNTPGIEYILSRVSSSDLVLLPLSRPVLTSLLIRSGVSDADRMVGVNGMAPAGGEARSRVLLWAIHTVDTGDDPQARQIIHELGRLLASTTAAGIVAPRQGLLALAEMGVKQATRSVGYAALIEADKDVRAAWSSASQTEPRVLGLLGAVELISDPELRRLLQPIIRSTMLRPPNPGKIPEPGSGLSVRFYEPAPKNAKRETLAELSPRAQLSAEEFTLDLAPANESDNFGLAFQGMLFVPESGLYTFSTSSDDGSRLYIGETSVVENDGPHGMVTRSGEIELQKGPTPILVTYFEAGGGDGLEVYWSGPGLERELIPAKALGNGVGSQLQHLAALAMAQIPWNSPQKLEDVTRLLYRPDLLEGSLAILGSVPVADRTPESTQALLDALLIHLTRIPSRARTSSLVARAIRTGRELADSLGSEQAGHLHAQLDALGGTSILLNTLPHQMLYDLSEFWVEAGKPVAIRFQNNDMMPHNLVITVPGALTSVGQAAEALGASAGSLEYVPQSDSVLWHTGLVLPGKSEVLTFIAPTELGDRPYVCTYPGHWRVMNGVMHVVAPGTTTGTVERRKSETAPALARAFVKDWSLSELLPKLEPGWEKGADSKRGERLFNMTGCINCHSVNGIDACAGPDLGQVGEKYQGKDLLAHILEPSKDVLEDYRFFIFELESGPDVIGRVLTEDEDNLHIVPTLLEPDTLVTLPKSEIVDQFDTGLSPMPTGMLVTLTEQEILDMLLFLQTKKDQ
jgi:putative heme-binding domain-containing protein